jgi:hypothetical protein
MTVRFGSTKEYPAQKDYDRSPWDDSELTPVSPEQIRQLILDRDAAVDPQNLKLGSSAFWIWSWTCAECDVEVSAVESSCHLCNMPCPRDDMGDEEEYDDEYDVEYDEDDDDEDDDDEDDDEDDDDEDDDDEDDDDEIIDIVC